MRGQRSTFRLGRDVEQEDGPPMSIDPATTQCLCGNWRLPPVHTVNTHTETEQR